MDWVCPWASKEARVAKERVGGGEFKRRKHTARSEKGLRVLGKRENHRRFLKEELVT